MIQIDILLPIPSSLREPLKLAESRKAGFLMKDQKKISRYQGTSFNYSSHN